ncbi:hypothetical protein quinque_002814 [Culex quinquefasciatus]
MSGKTISSRIDSRMPKTFRPRAVPQKPPAARCHSAEVSWTNSTAVDQRRPRTAATGDPMVSQPKPCHRLGHVPAYLRRSRALVDGRVSDQAGSRERAGAGCPEAGGDTAGSQAGLDSGVFEDEPVVFSW